MGTVEFLLNGEIISLNNPNPVLTLLDYLRNERGLTGTKEGCNEGDCGACTVMVSSVSDDGLRHQAQNACILFLPQLHGKSLKTVEGLSGPDGELHPVQEKMVDLHGSQCGFCTPGFIMSMAASHCSGDTNHNDALSGNLCRCTGYAPIVRAAEAASEMPVPVWMKDHSETLRELNKAKAVKTKSAYLPKTADELATWYAANPQATIIGGATDVGLWVNKSLRDLENIVFVAQIEDMQGVTKEGAGFRVGSSTTVTDFGEAFKDIHPDLYEMIRRFASPPVRNAATIGGNVANGSPIGDAPPALIALDATLRLRKGDTTREMPMQDFFVAYGKQDREPGEFVESFWIPEQQDRLKCYKLSKRFDQDISAVCGCFSITVHDGCVKDARIAFGGMAATPKRASTVEGELVGQSWRLETIRTAMALFESDYTPMTDMRASAKYRLQTAKNMLLRYYHETQMPLSETRVLEVHAS